MPADPAASSSSQSLLAWAQSAGTTYFEPAWLAVDAELVAADASQDH